MFSKTRLYQYGSDPKHVVRLTKLQAKLVNRIVITPVGENLFKANTPARKMKFYNEACRILNDYIAKNGPVPCDDLTAPILKKLK